MHYSKILLTALFLFGYHLNSFADDDLQQILDNVEISWAAETFTDYAPHANYREISKEKMLSLYNIKGRNLPEVIKIYNEPHSERLPIPSSLLSHRILNMSLDNITLYQSSDLKTKYAAADCKDLIKRNSIDTIITFDPETFEEIVQVVVKELNPNKVKTYRVKQIIYYNEKHGRLFVVPVAIAPLLSIYNKDGSLKAAQPLFWMSIKEFSEAVDFNVPAINWAKRISRTIYEEDIKVIKGKQSLGEIFGKLIGHAGQNAKTAKLYHTFSGSLRLTEEELKNMSNSVDTIITFDPNTFKEIIQVVHNSLEPTDITKLRVVQDWFWDKQTQQFCIRPVAIAPIIDRVDDAGNFLNSGPIFFQKNE